MVFTGTGEFPVPKIGCNYTCNNNNAIDIIFAELQDTNPRRYQSDGWRRSQTIKAAVEQNIAMIKFFKSEIDRIEGEKDSLEYANELKTIRASFDGQMTVVNTAEGTRTVNMSNFARAFRRITEVSSWVFRRQQDAD